MSSNVEDERTTLRHTVLRRGITAGVSTALEIGPLDRPVLPRPDYDVLYADWAPTSVLREKYADDPNVYEIVDVDIIWNGTVELSPVVPNGMTFDAVIASHVVEHVPDPVGWLQHLSSVLKPGGTVGLVIPDKRFTFDHNRRVSETADLIDAHVRRATVASYAQLYDFHTRALPVDTAALWNGDGDYVGQVRSDDLRREAYAGCVALRDEGRYVDVHCHTFTPDSFITTMEDLVHLGLLDLAIEELVPTQPLSFEFYVRLQKFSQDDPRREDRIAEGLERGRAALEVAPRPRTRDWPVARRFSTRCRPPSLMEVSARSGP